MMKMFKRGFTMGGILIGLFYDPFVMADSKLQDWWDDYPTIIQSSETSTVFESKATVNMCGAADDPCWGLYAQRTRIEGGLSHVKKIKESGMKTITWIEGFGEALTYIGLFKLDDKGGLKKHGETSDLSLAFWTHWNWQSNDQSGEIRWIGIHSFYNDEDFARPYTIKNPKYSCAPMTYPDGNSALGYVGDDATDPRKSRIFDAGCSKDLLGGLAITQDTNAEVNKINPETKAPYGPLNGLIKVAPIKSAMPNPGFTPEEWNALKLDHSYCSAFNIGKDSACPRWIDYLEPSISAAVESGIDGLWVDNFSPWDNFGFRPVERAFGEWSVARFRTHLRESFDSSAFEKMGVSDPESFDIRIYLKERCKKMGGKPDDLNDPMWRDSKWTEDPVWRAYLIHKRKCGTEGLTRYYEKAKAVAAKHGKPDFLVSGNDIPLFTLGWARGSLDMVSTELTWGWGLTTGGRGLMPPPEGSYTPVYKLAREHARSRLVNVWMYSPPEYVGKDNAARVLYYQALAHDTLPMVHHPHGRVVGSLKGDAEFFDFVNKNKKEYGKRLPWADIGIFYSSSSQLVDFTPGGIEHDQQAHAFSLWGWGTAFDLLHLQYRFIPEWKLSPEILAPLKVCIIPNAGCLDSKEIRILMEWVENGGRLIVTGGSGMRYGEEGNFDRAKNAADEEKAIRVNDMNNRPQSRTVDKGSGKIYHCKVDPGFAFYKISDFEERVKALPSVRKALEGVDYKVDEAPVQLAEAVNSKVGSSCFQDQSVKKVWVDLYNTDYTLANDTVKSTGEIVAVVNPPTWMKLDQIELKSIGPDAGSDVSFKITEDRKVEIRLSSLTQYMSVILGQK